MRVPVAFAPLLYALRIHIDLVRDRLQQSPQEDLPRAAQERG